MTPKRPVPDQSEVSQDVINTPSTSSSPKSKIFMVPKSPVFEETDCDIITTLPPSPEPDVEVKRSEIPRKFLLVRFSSLDSNLDQNEEREDQIGSGSTASAASVFLNPKFISEVESELPKGLSRTTSLFSRPKSTEDNEDVLTGEWTELNKTVKVSKDFFIAPCPYCILLTKHSKLKDTESPFAE